MTDTNWNDPIGFSKSQVWFSVHKEVSNHPFFSVFSDKAISAIVTVMVEALPVKSDSND